MYCFVHFCSLWWKQWINCHFQINVLETNKTNCNSLNTLVYVCYFIHSNDTSEFCRWLERWRINPFEKIIFKWKRLSYIVHSRRDTHMIFNWLKYTLTVHVWCGRREHWICIIILRGNVPNIHTATFTSNFWLLALLCENNFNWVNFFYYVFFFFWYGLLELSLFVYNYYLIFRSHIHNNTTSILVWEFLHSI